MKKIKLLTPILGVATLSSVIVPITSCSCSTRQIIIDSSVVGFVKAYDLYDSLVIVMEPNEDNLVIGVSKVMIGQTQLSSLEYSYNNNKVTITNEILNKYTGDIVITPKTIAAKSVAGMTLVEPDIVNYDIGEKLDLTGLTLLVEHADGTYETVTEGFTTVPEEGSSLPIGTSTVTVTYGGKSITFNVTVAEGRGTITGLEYEPVYDSTGTVIVSYKITAAPELTKGKGILPARHGGLPITTVEENAFKGNTKIQSIEIPEGYELIGEGAFEKCTNLESVSLPSTLIEINDRAFCMTDRSSPQEAEVVENKLTNVSIPVDSDLKNIGSRVFEGSNISDFTVPSNVVTIGSYCFDSCANLKEVDFKNAKKLQVIGELAFASCSELTEVSGLENTILKTINDFAFAYDVNLCGKITFPATLYKIENGAFTCKDCTEKITENPLIIEFADESNLRYLGAEVFYNRQNLTEITLPKNLLNIGVADFNYCTSLQALHIPYSVCRIGFSNSFGAYQSESMLILYGANADCKVTIEDHKNTWGSKTISGKWTYEALEAASADNPLWTGWSDGGMNKDFITADDTRFDVQFVSDTECLIGTLDNYVASSSTIEIPETIKVKDTSYKVTGIHINGIELNNRDWPPTTITLPETITFLDIETIKINNNVTSIYLPDSLKYIGKSAISAANPYVNATEIDMSLNILGTSDSTILESILPTSLEFMDDFAFIPRQSASYGDWSSNYPNITNIVMPANDLYIGQYVFYPFTGLTTVTDTTETVRDWTYGSAGEWWKDQTLYPAQYTTVLNEELDWSYVKDYLYNYCQFYYLKF